MAGPLRPRFAAPVPCATRQAGAGRRRHALGLALLSSAVVLAHAWVGTQLAERLADADAAAAMPPRMVVAFVREMEMAAPPTQAAAPVIAAAPAAAPQQRVPELPRAEPAASAAEAVSPAGSGLPPMHFEEPPVAQPEPVNSLLPLPDVLPAATQAAAAAEASASAPLPVDAAASAIAVSPAPPFEWPASTRLSYLLTGNYRGEIHGNAQVEWVHAGSDYQVHLDITVGLPFAPLLSRRMSSHGRLGPDGLQPLRYDEDSKVAFRDRRRLTMAFEPGAVILANGERRERLPGVQDTASQFVQLSYLFGMHPERLVPGGTVEVPLALPRRVNRWVYDVLEPELLHTPFGPVDSVHLKPRPSSASSGELTAEIWFAPALRYLPVRIRIRQDADTFLDLMIERKPQLAAP